MVGNLELKEKQIGARYAIGGPGNPGRILPAKPIMIHKTPKMSSAISIKQR